MKHGAQFEKSKYILIRFIHYKNTYTGAKLTIDDTTINPTKEMKYLGVIFDQELKYHTYTNFTIKKGTRFRLAIVGMARAK